MAPDCGLRRYSDEPYYPSREAVSEVMSGLQREGVIETRKTFILDRETLSEHASGLSGLTADGQIRI